MQEEPNFNLANYYSGELRGEVKWRALGWSMSLFGALHCPALQIWEDGEQKICLLWSPGPPSVCG